MGRERCRALQRHHFREHRPSDLIQILNNYFDNIAQTNRSGAQTAIYLAAQWGENDVAPSNVTISGNTCHDCFSFGNLQTSGTTLVSNNTVILDQMSGDTRVEDDRVENQG